MSQSILLNGTTYVIPDVSDGDWGENLTNFFVAIPQGVLQKTGGSFTLTANVNFGATYGLLSAYFSTRSSNPAGAGLIRLAVADSVAWRNNANNGNLLLAVNGSDQLTFNGSVLQAAGNYITALTGDVTATGPGSAAATIAAGAVDNGKISASAAIAFSKLASLSSANILVGSAGNVPTAVAVSGDISLTNAGVTAYSGTVPINKGGTGQVTATAGFDALSPNTTKGDITVRNSSSNTRLAVGTDGQVLTADAAETLGVKWTSPAASPTQAYEINNLGLSASVSANALTIALKQSDGSTNPSAGSPVKVGFRSATSATGSYSEVSATSATSIVVSSGSTLGQVSGQPQYIYVYALNNAGTIELAVSGSNVFDEGSVQTTTAEGGAGAADAKNTLYSTTARSNVGIRLIGRIKSTQTTAGTWAASVSEISLIQGYPKTSPRAELCLNTGNGYGSTASNAILRFTNSETNTGSGTTYTYVDSATDGASVTVNEDGLYSVGVTFEGPSNTAANIGVSRNASSLTTNISSLAAAERIAWGYSSAVSGDTSVVFTSRTLFLQAGDVIRPQGTTTKPTNTSTRAKFWLMQISR